MKINYDSSYSLPPIEDLKLHSGAGAYPIREKVIPRSQFGGKDEERSDEVVAVEMQELAELIQAARAVIELQGGIFNGTREEIVHRVDQDFMGMTIAISVLYALAYLPTE